MLAYSRVDLAQVTSEVVLRDYDKSSGRAGKCDEGSEQRVSRGLVIYVLLPQYLL